jgi:hypothetical protein
LFALDVFEEGYGFWKTTLALIIHLIPNFTLIIVLILSWRREWIGGTLFSLLGVCYIVMAWGKFDIYAYLFISGPLFLLGVLFFINWFYRAEIRNIQKINN